ncbi:MAG TPA: YkgJ family cysteine cluster protein [Nannocystaceae bacterium]|nr:YkgJ family cysteine cluster protein [Nannocystaceae bacterium]
MTLDCRTCGACCCNGAENRREGVDEWVEVGGDETIAKQHRGAALVVRNAGGVLHMRLVDGGRCIALRGSIGRRVSCSIYDVRPRPCRRVQAGDASCLRARADAGL